MDINDTSDSAICDRGGVLWLAVRKVCPCIDNVGVFGLGSSFDGSPHGIRGVVDISSWEIEASRERISGPSPVSRRISLAISEISQGVWRG